MLSTTHFLQPFHLEVRLPSLPSCDQRVPLSQRCAKWKNSLALLRILDPCFLKWFPCFFRGVWKWPFLQKWSGMGILLSGGGQWSEKDWPGQQSLFGGWGGTDLRFSADLPESMHKGPGWQDIVGVGMVSISLLFCCAVWPSIPGIWRVWQKRESPCFLRGFLVFFVPQKQGLEGQGLLSSYHQHQNFCNTKKSLDGGNSALVIGF